jgi:hypothetical protein
VDPHDIFRTGSATNAQQSRFSVPDGYFRKLPLGTGFGKRLR